MPTDADLNSRMRLALTSAAEAVDPPVDTLLEEATVRGRRRRTHRRAVVLAALLAVAAIPLGIIGLGGKSATAPVIAAAPPSRADLIGTWQTPSLSAGDWARTYQRAGGSSAQATAFLGPPMDGPAGQYRIVLRVTPTEWAVFVSADGRELEAGWRGGYRLDGPLIQVRATGDACEAAYRLTLSGGSLHVSVLADSCGPTDLLAQRTIYETAAFQRSG
ncbi:hypothetical protein ACQPZX_30905 [Actinoplanes sp. CA-142083]|uniref:hypothetical protein n=1 Tax=Actinoplanes sp. CA-142083 TaxID=3239903 RepID=UPI003D8E884B